MLVVVTTERGGSEAKSSRGKRVKAAIERTHRIIAGCIGFVSLVNKCIICYNFEVLAVDSQG
jgi:hypothetical protein